MINPLLDEVLDQTVVAGFTRVGYRIRSRGWAANELQWMQGKVVLVTGASSGLGLAAAEAFARLGASVWLIVRSAERGKRARARIIEQSGRGHVHVGLCDVSDLESVRQFAGRFRHQVSRLDVLVNNAGVMTEARGSLGRWDRAHARDQCGRPVSADEPTPPDAPGKHPGADHQRLLWWHVHAEAQG